LESTYRFYVTHTRLSDPLLKDGIVDDTRVKLTKKELSKQLLVKFDFPQIRKVYATMMQQGKVTLVVSEDPDAPSSDAQKTFKVMINGGEPAELKRMCQVIEEEMKARREKKEERDKRVEEEYQKKREAKIE
jgi:hypothetical protein